MSTTKIAKHDCTLMDIRGLASNRAVLDAWLIGQHFRSDSALGFSRVCRKDFKSGTRVHLIYGPHQKNLTVYA